MVLKPPLLQDMLCLACHGGSLEPWNSNSSPANLLLTRTGQHTQSSKLKFPYLENTDPQPICFTGSCGNQQNTGLNHLLCGNLTPYGLNIPKFSVTLSAHYLSSNLPVMVNFCYIILLYFSPSQITKFNWHECVYLPYLI